jgi:hypothetical protein
MEWLLVLFLRLSRYVRPRRASPRKARTASGVIPEAVFSFKGHPEASLCYTMEQFESNDLLSQRLTPYRWAATKTALMGYYFRPVTEILFLTDFTPVTFFAISPACFTWARLSILPRSVTTPLIVYTSIVELDIPSGSSGIPFSRAASTFAVMTESGPRCDACATLKDTNIESTRKKEI